MHVLLLDPIETLDEHFGRMDGWLVEIRWFPNGWIDTG